MHDRAEPNLKSTNQITDTTTKITQTDHKSYRTKHFQQIN